MSLIPTPDQIRRSFASPFTWGQLAVDLLPIYSVLALGWGAAPLVVLYWMVNAVIGVATLARMLTIGAVAGVIALAGTLFLAAFFTVHYGLFWFGHGIFVLLLAGDSPSADPGPVQLFQTGLAFAPAMAAFVAVYAAWEVVNYMRALSVGEFRRADLGQEMFSPYGRVIVLHVGIFAGAFALMAIGDPAIGVIGLILLHAAWNQFMSIRRRVKGETGTADAAPSPASS